ncbi:ABC transporter permease [Bradyrhizobium paxllaeri]|uniref:ABC transporter permease n=1 Tax=Bradyrhizobium paxllaeri TaxID=190148 RepID=UPI0008108EAD|nr:ABC transporter permease [Bradyrhizobium paxllaeri]
MLSASVVLAIREIRRHLLRSLLTVLGIIIGVAAVIVIVTVGRGATVKIVKQVSELGANLLIVEPGRLRMGGTENPPPFHIQDVEAVRSQLRGVRAVAPQVRTAVVAVRSGINRRVSVDGVTDEYLIAQSCTLASGRRFTPEEEELGKTVCLIGAEIRRSFFRDEDPLGKPIKLEDLVCEVVGVLTARGQSGFGDDRDSTIVLPLKAVQRRLSGNREVQTILIAVDPTYLTADLKSSLTSLLRERRRLATGTPDNFSITDTKQIIDAVSGVSKAMTALLGAVAAVSLLVGGIGIMNVMLVSVTERTREIGIRMAIGAVPRDVLLQFLVEAMILACLGSVAGITFALICNLLLASILTIPFLFDPWINLASFLFSLFLGIGFGYFPARRAATLNPIEALRHE